VLVLVLVLVIVIGFFRPFLNTLRYVRGSIT